MRKPLILSTNVLLEKGASLYCIPERAGGQRLFKRAILRTWRSGSVRILQIINIRQIPAVLLEIEPVTDQELVIDLLADILHRHIHDALGRFIQKRDDLDRSGP